MFYKKLPLLILLFHSIIYSQNKQPLGRDSVYTLEPVVVSARSENSIMNIPYTIDKIDSTKIAAEISGMSLNEILSQVPGLIVSNRNNPSMGDKITMRGIGSRASFGVRGIKILYDGIPLTFADGQSELNNLDFSSIGNIEVLHGPASSLYGNAAGGVINISSQNPSKKIFSFNPTFTAGSYGYTNYNIKTSGTVNRFSYLLSLNKMNSSGFREHSSASSVSLNSILSYEISEKISIKALINYFDSPYLLSPSSINKEDAENSSAYVRPYIISQGAGEKASEGNYGLTLNLKFDDNLTNRTTIYFIKRSLLNPIPGTIINLNRKAGGFRSVLDKKFPGIFSNVDLNFAGGFDFEFQSDLRKEFENNGLPDVNIKAENIFDNLQYGNSLLNQKEFVTGAAPFISANLIFNKKIELRGGLRSDNYLFKVDDYLLSDGNNSGKRKMNNISPMIGLIYLPIPYIKFYANYVTSFQTPTTNELSNSPEGGGGFNPALEPEKITSYELGSWGILPQCSLNFEAAFFVMKFNNMLISYQSQESGNEEIFYKNAGKAENVGGEIELSWSPLNTISFTASYTKMHFIFNDYLIGLYNSGLYEYRQLKGNYIPGIPQNYFSARMMYTTPFDLKFNLKAEWYDKYFTNDFNGPQPGTIIPVENYINNGYLRIDLILGYNLIFDSSELNFHIGIYNIFDKRYNASIVPNAAGDRFFEPSPGRNFYFKAEIKF